MLALPALADEAFDKRHAELLKRKDLQFSFEAVAPPPDLPSLPQWLIDFLTWIAPAFTWLLWGALGLGIAALIWFLGREIWSARWGRRAKADALPDIQEPDYRPEPARAHALLAEADRLAAEGRFVEAARVLLHRSIEDIEEKRPNAIRKAFTSREIEAMPALPGRARTAFSAIARAVENSWFGGQPMTGDGWSHCRKAYSDFAFPEAWS